MYNFYIYQKQNEKNKKLKSDEIKKISIEKKYKLKRNKLVEKYKQRINKFIFGLIKEPIIIHDYLNKVENTRKDLMNENFSNGWNTNFVYHNFNTDRERIEHLLKERKLVQENLDKIIKRNIEKEEKKNRNKIIFEQPEMRFKPRTDLERIVETMNKYTYNSKNNKIIQEQIKRMNINSIKKIKGNKNNIFNKKNSFFNNKNNSNISNINNNNNNNSNSNSSSSISFSIDTKGENTKHSNFNEQIKNINNRFNRYKLISEEFKDFMKDYSRKTHFKGAYQFLEEISNIKNNSESKLILNKTSKNFYNKINNNNKNNFFRIPSAKIFHNKSCNNLNKNNNNLLEYYSNIQNKRKSLKEIQKEKNKKLIKNIINNSNLSNFHKKFPLNEENMDIILSNPLLFQKENNNYFNDNSNDDYFYDKKNENSDYQKKLDYLKEIMNKKYIEKENDFDYNKKNIKFNLKNNDNNNNNKFYIKNDDNEAELQDTKNSHIKNIYEIDGKIYNISELQKITKLMLKKCNYVHNKSKHNNTCLKKGNGKLMSTSGLTINQFYEKYHL
jgi:hypothetical protein